MLTVFKSNCSNNMQANKHKPGKVAQTCYSSTGEAKAEWWWIWS